MRFNKGTVDSGQWIVDSENWPIGPIRRIRPSATLALGLGEAAFSGALRVLYFVTTSN